MLSGTRSPARLPPGQRVLWAIVGVLAFGGLAYLIVATASLTHAALSGCWLSCGGDPAPVWGAVWAVLLAALLATPIALALRFARVRSWIVWVAAAVVVLAVVAAWIVFSLDPDHADFFVCLGESGCHAGAYR